MKQLFFLFLLLSIIKNSSAQNVGIGTPTPNPSAALEIKSTNKGLLIPSMTTSQRLAIVTPANGLMVYDTDKNELYHYNGTNWRPILNGEYWSRGITSRDRIGNSTDSVGIGTLSPTERLDVNGNIRSRDDVLADGRVIATGTVTGSGLITSGGLTVGSSGLVGGNFTTNGDLSTNSDFTINNAAATMQLKNGSGVNKGFFQLSGDDVRFGTNSGNTSGDVIVRMNGNNRFTFTEAGRLTLSADNTPTINFNSGGSPKASLQVQGEDLTINAPGNKVRISNVVYVDDATNRVGIGTISPTERLHVDGNMLVTGNAIVNSGRITSTANGIANNLLPLAYGKVSFEGNKISGTDNFTSANTIGTGRYNLFVTGANSSTVLIVTAENYFVPRISYQGAGWYRVEFITIGADPLNTDFNFVMYRP
jgi:hypothetical protein